VVGKIFSILTFEMGWENCDGDPNEIFLNRDSALIKFTKKILMLS
jgi:hypothetical protein